MPAHVDYIYFQVGARKASLAYKSIMNRRVYMKKSLKRWGEQCTSLNLQLNFEKHKLEKISSGKERGILLNYE